MTQDNPRMGDLNELVERLGTPHTLDIRDIVQVRALLDLVAVERSEAATALTSLIAERDEARTLVAEANNSLYGSQGYFHSLNGGAFDKYHLATGIENLKSNSRKEWRRAEAAEAQLKAAREALNNIRELNMSGVDDAGHRWANSDLIEQEIVTALSLDTNKGDGV